MAEDNQDTRVELFIFPDGSAVEIIVAPAFSSPASSSASSQARSSANSPAKSQAKSPANSSTKSRTSKRESATATHPAPLDDHATLILDGSAHVCPLCASDLVYPVDGTRFDDNHWRLTLRCPNCELSRDVVLTQEGAERLDHQLCHGLEVIAHEADELTRQHFEEEGEKLIDALRNDRILPIDF
jgi:hypothetical protein